MKRSCGALFLLVLLACASLHVAAGAAARGGPGDFQLCCQDAQQQCASKDSLERRLDCLRRSLSRPICANMVEQCHKQMEEKIARAACKKKCRATQVVCKIQCSYYSNPLLRGEKCGDECEEKRRACEEKC